MNTPSKEYNLENLTSDIKNFNLISLPKGPEDEAISFIVGVIKKFAVEQKNPILLFSLERSIEKFCIKLLFAHSKIKQDDLSNLDWKKICEIADIISNAPLFIEDNTNMTVKVISSKIKRLKKNKNLGIIIIDNFYLIKSFNHPMNKNTLGTDAIAKELKKLTKKLQIPIITFYPANGMNIKGEN